MTQVSTALNKHTIVGIVAENSPAYVEQVFAALAQGHQVVPLRAGDDQYRIETAGVGEIMTPAQAQDAQWLSRRYRPRLSDETAMIAFTSGTEGTPKGVAVTHNNLNDVVERLNDVMQLDDSIREYVGVPVYLSFGFGRCRAVATAGGQSFIPKQGFNPVEIATLLTKGRINAISAVPSLWRVLLENPSLFSTAGKQVKWIEIGSQYMSAKEKKTLKALFPNARIVQHYGLTEASRTSFLVIDTLADDVLESVGKPYGKTRMKITDSGNIAIKGPHLAQAYLIDKQFQPLADTDGWFVTNDLGEEKNGYFYFKGRADDVINCGGLKLSPEKIEIALKNHLSIDTALAVTRRADARLGDGFLLALTPSTTGDQARIYHALVEVLKDFSVNASDAIAIVTLDALPTTASGKIQRKLIAQQYADSPIYKKQAITDATPDKNKPDKNKPDKKMSANEAQIADLCEQVFNIQKMGLDDNFYDIGISSLAIIQLLIKISVIYKKDLSANDIFKAPSVRQLTELIHRVDEGGERQDHAIDILRIGEQGTPFFFIGSPIYANNLCKRLDSQRPMYALNIFGLESLYRNKLHNFTIYDIADYFYKEIKALQAHGPYALGAFCADENIAMEIARLLLNDGEKINYFGFFDVTANFTRPMSKWKKAINKIKSAGPKYIWLVIKRKFHSALKTVRIYFGKRRYRESLDSGQTISLADRDQLVVERFWRANREYVPQPVAVDIVAYRSVEWSHEPLDILSACVNTIDSVIIPGDHSSMFLEERSLSVLADAVQAHLKARD
ncbi:MAG: AMP-binding protein [Cellvibrionaceae bacterium]|nr:AMP-binding protein [Cellvibrionaceae bacterium]